MTPVISILFALMAACFTGDTVYDNQSGGYALEVPPHTGVGAFKLDHDPDRPVLAYYGGIGLQLDENGEWTDYGITSKDAVDYLIKRCTENGMKRICANIMFQWTPSKLLGPIPNTPVPADTVSRAGWRSFEQSLTVGYRSEHCLETTTVRVCFPRGTGVCDIDDVVLTLDPLHNPMNPNPKEESR